MKYLLAAGVVLGRYVVDYSKSVLEGDNQAFPVENNNKDKKSTEPIGYCILVCCFICTQY